MTPPIRVGLITVSGVMMFPMVFVAVAVMAPRIMLPVTLAAVVAAMSIAGMTVVISITKMQAANL